MSSDELQHFRATWDREAAKTAALLRTLPADKYDFRPDPDARSLGELSWHLAESDAYMSYGAGQRKFTMGEKPPGIVRPREVAALAPEYERVHGEAVERLKGLKPEDLDTEIPFFMGNMIPIRTILWDMLIHHMIHHRGQLSVLNRLAGGASPGMYGPSREEMAEMMKKMGK